MHFAWKCRAQGRFRESTQQNEEFGGEKDKSCEYYQTALEQTDQSRATAVVETK